MRKSTKKSRYRSGSAGFAIALMRTPIPIASSVTSAFTTTHMSTCTFLLPGTPPTKKFTTLLNTWRQAWIRSACTQVRANAKARTNLRI